MLLPLRTLNRAAADGGYALTLAQAALEGAATARAEVRAAHAAGNDFARAMARRRLGMAFRAARLLEQGRRALCERPDLAVVAVLSLPEGDTLLLTPRALEVHELAQIVDAAHTHAAPGLALEVVIDGVGFTFAGLPGRWIWTALLGRVDA